MPLILFVLFLVVPLMELAVIFQVQQFIGLPPTLLLLLAVSIAGAVLVRREGTRAWRRFREALGELRLPTAEVVDGALVLLGGTLMLTPGFVTDAVGLLLVIPPTRALVARAVRGRVRIVTLGGGGMANPRRGRESPRDAASRQRPGRRHPGRDGPDGRDGRADRGGRHDDQEPYDVEVVSIERNDPPDRSTE
jgi:UPF0716 protein FxsA